MNVEEIAANGRIARRWCFAPEGAPAAGDVMLAQKIALETFELNALAIANNDGRQGAVFPSRSFLDIDELVWLVLAFACFVTLVWSFFFTGPAQKPSATPIRSLRRCCNVQELPAFKSR